MLFPNILKKVVQVGASSLEQIEKPYERTMAAAAFMAALAAFEDNAVKNEAPEDGNRLSLSPDAEEAEAAVEPEAVATEAEDEWNETALDDKVILDSFINDYGIEAINEHYVFFTDQVKSSIEEITPLDIASFVAYLQGLTAEDSEQAQ